MVRLYWLFAALVLSGALATLEFYALQNYLYWRLWWFDIPMHLLGGLTVGTFLVGFLIRYRPVLFFLLALASFGAWEVFEYMTKIPHQQTNYVFDTALDVLDGALGALVAYIVARSTLWKNA